MSRKNTSEAGSEPSTPEVKKTRTPVNKQERLVKLASQRVSRAIRAILQVGALGKYQPTETQRAKITGALNDAIDNATNALAVQTTVSKENFAL